MKVRVTFDIGIVSLRFLKSNKFEKYFNEIRLGFYNKEFISELKILDKNVSLLSLLNKKIFLVNCYSRQ